MPRCFADSKPQQQEHARSAERDNETIHDASEVNRVVCARNRGRSSRAEGFARRRRCAPDSDSASTPTPTTMERTRALRSRRLPIGYVSLRGAQRWRRQCCGIARRSLRSAAICCTREQPPMLNRFEVQSTGGASWRDYPTDGRTADGRFDTLVEWFQCDF